VRWVLSNNLLVPIIVRQAATSDNASIHLFVQFFIHLNYVCVCECVCVCVRACVCVCVCVSVCLWAATSDLHAFIHPSSIHSNLLDLLALGLLPQTCAN